MTPLQSLTSKIQKACPELARISVGCHVMRPPLWDRHVVISLMGSKEMGCNLITTVDDKGQLYPNLFSDGEDTGWKVLGHPIQLQHVLRAMDLVGNMWAIEEDGTFMEEVGFEKGGWRRKMKWDLTKDLSGQSPETIEWLNNLVK